jgi:hypothetical protein
MPLFDIFWATVMIGGFVLSLWLLWIVLRDIFGRPDLSGGAKVGWTVLACVLPIAGSVIYLVSRGPEAEDLNLGFHTRRDTATMYR